ncbi:histidine kinase [Luteimonas sp. RD2P54]|uniref:Histidine kinase n=1 Tax=Luteimonas endophytica TaxID=3042023 RepID=A0ABT6J946_9GAMM|nr:histidine kinase [Luteimonas endophytica]MDH5823130.1 histidine kinase [Luteimonas endophytica]
MSIAKVLGAPAVLVMVVAAWLLAASHGPVAEQVLSAEMAPAPVPVSGRMPERPPEDLDWQPLDPGVLAGWRDPHWLRWRVAAPADDAGRLLHLSLRAASRPYWNGRPLVANGIVGRSRSEEQPGLIDIVRVLPPSERTGADELIVLASSQHQWLRMDTTDAALQVVPVEGPPLHRPGPWLIVAFAAGALAAAWLYFLAAQRGQPRAHGAALLLALGAVGLALPVVEAWRPLFGYAYPWHGLRMFALLALHAAAAVLLPAYLAHRFDVGVPMSARIVYLATLVGAIAFLPSFDGRGATVLLLSLLASAWLLVRARGEHGERRPILILMLTGALAMPVAGGPFLDGPYFLLLAVLMGFLLLRHAERLRSLDRHNARLREERARLALQLLQRGIQPHWLMNTLTCLQELIEQAPPRASRLVESLAQQFDRLRDSSTQPLVPLEDELALCRNHLDIVGQALGGQPIGLEIDADDTDFLLPPGVLHAQVENALTHAGAEACTRHPFRLRVRSENGRRALELRGPRGSAVQRGQGTGTRYIEASLAAAFPGGWRFTHGPDDADWCGRIELPCAS